MCIAVIRVKDNPGTRSYVPGDIVTFANDGHVFTPTELNTKKFRMINLPNVPKEDMSPYLEEVSEIVTIPHPNLIDFLESTKIVKRRKKTFDLSKCDDCQAEIDLKTTVAGRKTAFLGHVITKP